MTPLLAVEGLSVAIDGVRITEDVSFTVGRGEAVALVGESGCGKSVTARAILRLLPTPPATIEAGHVRLGGRDLLPLGERDLRAVRGREVGFVFQQPMSALNPVLTVGEQIAERLRRHRGLKRREALEKTTDLLRQVGIPDPARRAQAWPHQLSGGMCQRVMVAMALACDPALLIADEPTTALDVTIQAQILDLIRTQQRTRDMALLLITHDLALVAGAVDRIVVMYAGQVVEAGPVAAIFDRPRHPYTRGLLMSVPGATPPGPDGRLRSIHGVVPRPKDFPRGCRFAPRCDRATDACRQAPVPLTDGATAVRCLHPHDEPLALRN
jgi:oligopeptide/dipeptide ABC transporter ATP-binding protein